jgi:hypothetical protein
VRTVNARFVLSALALVALAGVRAEANISAATLRVYPAPQGVGLSGDYTVAINGRKVDLYRNVVWEPQKREKMKAIPSCSHPFSSGYPGRLGHPLCTQEPVPYLAALGDKPWRPCAWHFPHMWPEQIKLTRQLGASVGVSNGWIEYTGLAHLPANARTKLLLDIAVLCPPKGDS